MENINHKAAKSYKSYDYGSGYFYQSLDMIGVSGFRDTQKRVEQLKLKERLKDKKVLDIGTNVGFILFSVGDVIQSATAIEYNPFLVQIANLVKEYLNQQNIYFINDKFENFVKNNSLKFDVVMSLANHSTYDGNTEQTIHEYFHNVANCLNSDGILIFESHPPQIEPEDKLEITHQAISKYFNIIERPNVSMNTFLDKNRTYYIGKLK